MKRAQVLIRVAVKESRRHTQDQQIERRSATSFSVFYWAFAASIYLDNTGAGRLCVRSKCAAVPKDCKIFMGFSNTGVKLAAILLTIVAAISVYMNALTGDFVHDDVNMVLRNPWIMDARNIPDILLSNAWGFEERSSNFYRPIAFLFYMASYYFFGLDPWGFHLVNTLLHAAVSVLVLLVADILFQNAYIPSAKAMERMPLPMPLILATFAALLFATHPIHTEPVAWVSCISDLLFSFFFLVSLYFHISTKMRHVLRRSLSLLFFFLAVLCKETALTLPIMFFAYDLLIGRNVEWSLRGLRQLAMRYTPIVIVTVLYMALRTYALGGFAPTIKPQDLSAYQYFINVFPLFAQYLAKLVLPINLNVFYGFDPILSPFTLAELSGVAALTAYIAAFVWLRRRNRLAAFCLLWILIPLLPVLYLPALGGNPFSERYLYLPAAGFVMLLVMAFHHASAWLTRRSGGGPTWVIVASSLIVAMYAAATVARNPVWASNVTLWEDAERKSPDEYPVYINLGSAYFEERRFDEALTAVRQALHLNPRSSEALYGLGSIYFAQNKMPEAINALGLALRFDPRSPVKHYHLGVALARNDMPDEAIEQFRQSISLNPEYAEAHYQLGLLYAKNASWEEAIAHYERAVQIEPVFSDAYLELGRAYEHVGALEKAARAYGQAFRFGPDLADAQRALGLLYERSGDFKMALQAFESVLEIEPSASAFVDLGRALLSSGMPREAEKAFRDALRLDPGDEKAQDMLNELGNH